ncbi:MAG TPA: antibiotic biosynthesis monooxygenase [Chlamydiales bacterium]|nr:antibiotic biosynthesis monooxygenase [Chlamydiales bacterium]
MPVRPSPIYVVEAVLALEGKQKALKTELAKLVPLCRKEKGAISYELFQDLVNPSLFRAVMRWNCEEDYKAHTSSPHIQGFAQKFEGVLYDEKQIVEDAYRHFIPGQPLPAKHQNASPGEAILCISYFRVKPQHRDELIRALLTLVALTQKEPGCIYYELYVDATNANLIVLTSKFIHYQAFDDHEKEPYIARFVEGPMTQYCEEITWNESKEVV